MRLKGAKHTRQQWIGGIKRRADPPLHVGPCRRLKSDDFCQPISFGSCQAVVEMLAIGGMLQARRDIVEQHCEGTHSRIVETLRLRQQNAQRLLGAKQKCLAGMKAVNKIDVALSCFANDSQER